MKKLMLGGAAALAILVGTQLFMAPEDTLIARLGALGGQFEKEWVEARTESVAAQAEALREAEARARRRDLANQKALDLETKLLNTQIEKTRNATWAKEIGAIMADIGCGMSLFTGAQTPKEAEQQRMLCEAGDQLRRSIAKDFAEAIDGTRSEAMREFTEKFRDAETEMAR